MEFRVSAEAEVQRASEKDAARRQILDE